MIWKCSTIAADWFLISFSFKNFSYWALLICNWQGVENLNVEEYKYQLYSRSSLDSRSLLNSGLRKLFYNSRSRPARINSLGRSRSSLHIIIHFSECVGQLLDTGACNDQCCEFCYTDIFECHHWERHRVSSMLPTLESYKKINRSQTKSSDEF